MSVYERQTLSNGLRVLTAPLPNAQSVSCFIMLAAGSRYEHAENRGIAHFAEHMFFKGTERRPDAMELTQIVDGIGGECNAFTSKEYTGYFVRCAGADRDVALDVLVDMIRHSKFDPDEIEREKGVILEEMNMYADTPRAPAPRDGDGVGDVVAVAHRGARTPRPRLLRLRRQPLLHRRGLALLAGGRRHHAHRRGDQGDLRPVPPHRRREGAGEGADE